MGLSDDYLEEHKACLILYATHLSSPYHTPDPEKSNAWLDIERCRGRVKDAGRGQLGCLECDRGSEVCWELAQD